MIFSSPLLLPSFYLIFTRKLWGKVSAWLPEREITIEKLHTALAGYSTDSTEDRFLRVLQGLITDIAQAGTPCQGKTVFDALDKASHGYLTNWLGELSHYTQTPRPFIDLDLEEPEEERRVRNLPPVILPLLLNALLQELVKWQKELEWNSLVRIGPAIHGGGYALFITEPLQIPSGKEGKTPPITILDATADPDILGRMLGKKLKIHRVEMNPAPGTQHIAVRSGKRYGKTSLTAKLEDGSPSKHLTRAIKECRYMLQKLDPDGEQIRAESVGIISFMGCVDAIADALAIPEHRRGHYWGIRGSNHLEDCSILLLVGTPTLRPDELLRQARTLYRDDPELIRETDPDEYKQTGRHTDPRLQHYAEYMTNSELTQAAHRSRAIRYENRIIISFCDGDIDFLPVTETIIELPYMTEDGQNLHDARLKASHERLEKAYEELSKDGKKVTQALLASTAKAGSATAREWLRSRAQLDDESVPQNRTRRGNIDSYYPYESDFGEKVGPIKSVPNADSEKSGSPLADIKEDARVVTPLGQGTVLRVYHCPILKRARVAVIIDGSSDGLKGFDPDEVSPVATNQSPRHPGSPRKLVSQ